MHLSFCELSPELVLRCPSQEETSAPSRFRNVAQPTREPTLRGKRCLCSWKQFISRYHGLENLLRDRQFFFDVQCCETVEGR